MFIRKLEYWLMNFHLKLFLYGFFVFFCVQIEGHSLNDSVVEASLPIYLKVGKCEYRGDSIPDIVLPTLYKYSRKTFYSEREKKRYNRLVRNVKIVLPIAKLVKHIIIETYDYLETLPTEKERQEHIVLVEKSLRKQYGPMMKKLSYSQGKLLIKLIDRECNQTSYDMVKAFFGPVRAGFYQVFSSLFGANLKKRYDPKGDDRYTEMVIRMVESGQL